jgi:hypothetical protein
MTHVRVEAGRVLVGQWDDDWGWCDEPDGHDPDDARQLAAALLAAADEGDRQRAAIRAACAGGHDWGEPHNTQVPDKATWRICARPGCRAYDEQPGWVPFAGRWHPDPLTGREITCTGPGCDACDSVAVGQAVHAMMSDARDRMEAAFLVPVSTSVLEGTASGPLTATVKEWPTGEGRYGS